MLKKIYRAMFLPHFTAMDYILAAIVWFFIIGSVVNPLIGLLCGLV